MDWGFVYSVSMGPSTSPLNWGLYSVSPLDVVNGMFPSPKNSTPPLFDCSPVLGGPLRTLGSLSPPANSLNPSTQIIQPSAFQPPSSTTISIDGNANTSSGVLSVPKTTHLGVPITRTLRFSPDRSENTEARDSSFFCGTNMTPQSSGLCLGGESPTFSPPIPGAQPLANSATTTYFLPDTSLFKSSISPPSNPLHGTETPPQSNNKSLACTPPTPIASISVNTISAPPPPIDTYTQPAIMFRNLFHSIECQLPLNDDLASYNGWRIFIDDSVGYAGNGKVFKRAPDKDEQALLLTVKVTDKNKVELYQCNACREYFENRMYFKANPHIKGRIVLVKNNKLMKLENGAFKASIKFMCCCKHHHLQHYLLHLYVTDNISNNLVASAQFPIYVKQWRKSTQKKQSCTIMLSWYATLLYLVA